MTGVDELIAAWVRWERHPRSEHATNAKCDAIDAAGLSGIAIHQFVAAARRAGYDIPSSVQRSVLNLGWRETA